MENIYTVLFIGFPISLKKKLKLISILFLSLFLLNTSLFAQNTHTIKGQVLDNKKQPLIGATVLVKFLKGKGTITDIDGNFSINVSIENVPAEKQIVVISSVGFQTQEINVAGKESVLVELKESSINLSDVVVVGYGSQKKESVVGAITQTKGEVLERAGGVSSLGAALTGSLPGVTTVSTTGAPGGEDPKIFIRAQSSWNNSDPLVLVDGIERPMKTVDISSVESISVLKDASATAVFGVKGANGVILITTKRGKEGKAEIRVTANNTIKLPSRLATKYDSYDALRIRNLAVENELGITPESWGRYTPYAELNKYRNPSSNEEAERYPNVDWANELVKKYTTSQNLSVNIAGGTSAVKYFTAFDLLNEGDILKKTDNGKSYDPGYGYKRMNVRSNLDLNLTKTTVLTANISGSYGVKQDAWNQDDWEYRIWASIYSSPPDAYMAHYSDGTYGFYKPDPVATINSVQTLANNGIRKKTETRINTDFTLKQDLGMILSGLSAKGTFSLDNSFFSVGGISDDGTVQTKYIDPVTGEAFLGQSYGKDQFDFLATRWSPSVDTEYKNRWGGSENFRKLFYQFQIDYLKKIGANEFTAMGLFSRDKKATGSEFPHYREDWVSRVTYNYSHKYSAEFNGAYNGSEQFGPNNRFDFFPSAALGWTISEEGFMKKIKFLDMLKFRASWGQVGSDFFNDRFLNLTEWETGGNAKIGAASWETSPYTNWKVKKLGNSDIHWEKVTKTNFGVDYAFLDNLISGSVDVFKDHRTDILLEGGKRAIPPYFGGTPASGNIGEVIAKGYEISIHINKKINSDLRVWADLSMTHSKDKIIVADDPELMADYMKKEGKQIDQSKSYISSGYYNTWDQLYGSTKLNTNDSHKLPGNLNMIDFNGDGVVDSKDVVPYGYPERPQNTYNATIGFEWRNFSAFVQFYGVNNCNRYLNLTSFSNKLDRVYNQGSYWSKDNTTADIPTPRFNSYMDYSGTNFLYDGSYIRLKNAEIAYTFKQSVLQKFKVSSLRIYLNGDNMWMWSKLPDDREVNLGLSSAYPTVRRFNMGVNLTF